MNKKQIFSGIQPSGNLHLGNYLGAIANWVTMQDEFDSIFCVVDMHAITVPQDPAALRQKTIEIAKIYLASGIDPEKSAIFVQSHIVEHSELAWILNTITGISELERMTQFKSKSGIADKKELLDEIEKMVKHATIVLNKAIHASSVRDPLFKDINQIIDNHKSKNPSLETISTLVEITRKHLLIIENYKIEIKSAKKIVDDLIEIIDRYELLLKKQNVSVGLFDYPVLMAADIILYDTAVVPVGEDQLQHIELARELAKRFNKRFGPTFVVPEFFVKKEGMRIMGLDDPTKKMSKSAKSEYNYIALNDSAEIIRKKIKKAVTDSGSEIVYRDDKPALKNLLNIYSSLSHKTTLEIEAMYVGRGYGDFKTDLAEVIIDFLQPLQEKMASISDEQVLEILRAGAEKVRPLARKKLEEVKGKIGFIL